jgi:hypothetical protein
MLQFVEVMLLARSNAALAAQQGEIPNAEGLAELHMAGAATANSNNVALDHRNPPFSHRRDRDFRDA